MKNNKIIKLVNQKSNMINNSIYFSTIVMTMKNNKSFIIKNNTKIFQIDKLIDYFKLNLKNL